MSNEFTVALFGRFDPLKFKHLQAIRTAEQYGDVYVFLQTDDVFLKNLSHAELVGSIRHVTRAALFENVIRTLTRFTIPRHGKTESFSYVGFVDDIEPTEEIRQTCIDLQIKLLPNL